MSLQILNEEYYKNLETQLRSHKEQSELLNEEISKLTKSGTSTARQKRQANKLAREVLQIQRNYVTVLECFVYRPLADPDDGAVFKVSFRDKHIATLELLAQNVKSNKNRILGCSIPEIGKTEHTDAFNFVHALRNEALQVQYLCNHLQEAYGILCEKKKEKQKKVTKWRMVISKELEVSLHLQKLVLQGVPSQYRACLWLKLVNHYVADIRNSKGESYYDRVLRQQENYHNDNNMAKCFNQIRKDIPRTMPNNNVYAINDVLSHKEKLQKLENVLRAFCIHNPEVGYCQGFNFLAGVCLFFVEEKDAFWFLVAVVEKIFPPYYYQKGMSGLLADQKVLQHIISQALPELDEHLMNFPDFNLAAITTKWFIGLFFNCLPFQTLIRVWDCFLSHGHEAVFRFAFAMFKLFASRLLELTEFSQLIQGIENIPKLCIHHEELIKEAFITCSFPSWKKIEKVRTKEQAERVIIYEKELTEKKRIAIREEDHDQLCHSEECFFNCGTAVGEHAFLVDNCRITKNPQLYHVKENLIRPHCRLPNNDRVTCVYAINDIILVGLSCGQLQAYFNDRLRWRMSFWDEILCIISYDVKIGVGTADGKVHFLQITDVKSDHACSKKPALLESVELSKHPTTCFCYLSEQACLWVASGPAIFVVGVEDNETEAFFLISSRIDFVSAMLHWSSYVLISVRGSSLIQLHSAEAKNSTPLLVYDIARQMVLPPSHPMMPVKTLPDENDASLSTSSNITSIALISEDVFWVGTAGGDVETYKVEWKSDLMENTHSKAREKSNNNLPNAIMFRRLRRQHVARKSIRCLIKTEYLPLTSQRITKCVNLLGLFEQILSSA